MCPNLKPSTYRSKVIGGVRTGLLNLLLCRLIVRGVKSFIRTVFKVKVAVLSGLKTRFYSPAVSIYTPGS